MRDERTWYGEAGRERGVISEVIGTERRTGGTDKEHEG